jgi:RNA polymerase sigma-70 factor (ECF subfamily)
MPGDEKIKEDELLLSLKKGEEEAFRLVYMKFSGKVYGFAMKYLHSSGESEEIVQDVFLKLWQNRSFIDPSQGLDGYLFTICRNTIFNLNKQKRFETAYRNYVRQNISLEYGEAEADFIYRDLCSYIQDVVDEFPAKRREIFNLSREKYLSYRQIAQRLDISERTVETHIRLALQDIRKALLDQVLLFPLIAFFL